MRRFSIFTSLISCLSLFLPQFVHAEVVADGTLNSKVTASPDNAQLLITGGTVAGSNLFHSFDRFSINTGQTVSFASANAIATILTRVTGNSISNIDGRLAVEGNANLFLLNPNGITFGRNAQLAINGSFIASTAERVRFADGSEFRTATQTPPLLTISAPIGLQFDNRPASIVNRAIALNALPGQTLGLAGGDLRFDNGSLNSFGGTILLVSANGSGTLNLTGETGIQRFGKIELSGTSAINASGPGGGAIQIRGGDIELRDRSVLISNTTGAIDGKDISIQANQLTVQDQSAIQAWVNGQGQGGNLTITATDSVTVNGNASSALLPAQISTASIQGSGTAGNLTINARQIQVTQGGLIETSSGTLARGRLRVGSGAGGDLTLNATDEIRLEGIGLDRRTASIISSTTFGSGKAGDMTLNTRRLVSLGQSLIVGSTFGSGQGGTATLHAAESVQIEGSSSDVFGIGTNSGKVAFQRAFGIPEATGAAGDVRIFTPQLFIQNQGAISVDSVGSGNAGSILVNSEVIKLDNGKINAATDRGGKGDIDLRSRLLLLRNNSQITASTNRSDGGNIRINTEVLTAIPTENSDIAATAIAGRGGTINIKSQTVFGFQSPNLTSRSDITASSEANGLDGTVKLTTFGTAPAVMPQLPTAINSPPQMVQTCAPNASANSFTMTGRGGIAPDLAETNRATPVWQDNRTPATALPSAISPPDQMLEATGWIKHKNGSITLVADADAIHIANRATPCNS